MSQEVIDDLADSYIGLMCGSRTIGWEHRTELDQRRLNVLTFLANNGSQRAKDYLIQEREDQRKREELRKAREGSDSAGQDVGLISRTE